MRITILMIKKMNNKLFSTYNLKNMNKSTKI